MSQIVVRNEDGFAYYGSVEEFLASRLASELTTALAIILSIDHHRLANTIARLQCEALKLEIDGEDHADH